MRAFDARPCTSTIGGPSAWDAYGCATGLAGPERVYRFEPLEDVAVEVRLMVSPGADLDLVVLEDHGNGCDPMVCTGVPRAIQASST